MTLLAGKALLHAYGAREVLSGVSVGVAASEVVGVLGPNGAGKSTCFRLLAGVEAPGSGRVFLGDRDVTKLALEERARLGLGYLPQEPSVFRGLTARGNVEIALEAHGVPRKHRRSRADALLDDVGLTSVAGTRADRLSGGERRKLEITRLLAIEPRVLLLDEPFTGLDPLAGASLRGLLRKLALRGIGILLTDHHVAQALPTCDRALLLVDGRVLLEGPPDAIVADRLARGAYLGVEEFRED